MAQAIKVSVRFRGGESGFGETGENLDDLVVGQETVKMDERNFTFDSVLTPDLGQEAMYDAIARRTVDSFLEGFNATVFAYGQSGSGKTFTMLGPDQVLDVIRAGAERVPEEVQQLYGVIPRATLQIFEHINDLTKHGRGQATLRVFYFEVYNEGLNNILTAPVQTGLKMRESPDKGIVVLGVEPEYVSNPEEIFELLQTGTLNRAVAGTNQNARSSRSHTMFVLDLEQNFTDGSKRRSRLNLVDLAGSERIEKTGAAGQTLEEAKKINQSLSCLGNCILALTASPGPTGKRPHVPFRDSKLTFFLKQSLGGNSKTSLVCTASRKARHHDETLQTLRFASRAKKIKNKAKSNVTRSARELEALVEQLKAETKALRAQLAANGIKVDLKAIPGEEKKEQADNQQESAKLALTDLQARYDTLKQESELKIASLNEQLIQSHRRASRRVSFQKASPIKVAAAAAEGTLKVPTEDDEIKTDSEDDQAEGKQTDLQVELEQIRTALEDARLTIVAKTQFIEEQDTEMKAKEYTLNRQITGLNVKVKALQQQKISSQQIIEEYQTKLHDGQNELVHLKEKYEGMEQNLHQNEEQVKELDSQLLAKEAEFTVLKETAAASKAMASESKKSAIASKLHINVLQAEAKRAKAEIERYKQKQEQDAAELKDLNETNEKLKQQTTAQGEQLGQLLIGEHVKKNQLAEMETHMQKIKQQAAADMDVLETTIKSLKQELQAASGKVAEEVERQNQSKNLIGTYTQKLSQQLDEIMKLKKALHDAELQSSQASKEAENARLELMEGRHADALQKAKLLAQESELKALKENIEQMKQEMASQTREAEQRQGQMDKGLEEAEARFEKSLEAAKEQMKRNEENWNKQRSNLESELKKAREELKRQIALNEELRKKLQKLENDNLLRRQAVEREVNEAQKQISMAREELRQKSDQQNSINGDLVLTKQRLRQVEEELERAQARAERKQREALQEAARKKKRRDTKVDIVMPIKPRHEVFGVVLKKTNSKFLDLAIREAVTKRGGPIVRDLSLEEQVQADQDWQLAPKEIDKQELMDQIDWNEISDTE